MSSPRIPDFDTLWNTSDDETATEWLRLADSFAGGLFLEPGEHTEDPAQVVFLLYLLEWSIQQNSNLLVFTEHRDKLGAALERWSGPLGGEVSPQYAFWRLQGHRFWRLMSWQECCEVCDRPRSERDRFPPDASVGVLDERAWLAAMSDTLLRHNMLTYLTLAYWPEEHEQVAAHFDVPDPRAAFETSGRSTTSGATRRKQSTLGRKSSPGQKPTPTFVRNRAYPTGELSARLGLLGSPEECPLATVDAATTALLISDASWRIEPPPAHEARGELHWPFSNRRYDNWLVLAELSDADRLLVFTKEPEGDAYRCRGLYELVSLDQRKWSFIRQIHDVIMRPAHTGATYV